MLGLGGGGRDDRGEGTGGRSSTGFENSSYNSCSGLCKNKFSKRNLHRERERIGAIVNNRTSYFFNDLVCG